MLPDNFDFAMLPVDKDTATLKEIGMLASTIENIDYAITSWLKEDLIISTTTNEGFIKVPVLWQVPERAYQVKFKEDLRDDGDALKLPIISIERTGITKDPARKGAFQAHLYSDKKNGRSGRMVIAKKIVQDKTRNFAAASGTRGDQSGAKKQLYYPRVNKKVVIKSLSIPIPVYVNLDYKVTLKCEYQQQMNEILTPFATVGADMRMYTSEITIKVLGYLIGEGESDDRPLVQIHENVVEISFPSEEAVPEGNDSLFL